MMTLGVHDMADLCQLSFEFKAKLCIIAFERMRRNRTAREIVEYCAREFGLDPDDFIAGTERADDGEDPHVARSISTRYNGATRQVVFVEDWKTLVVDRVVHSMVATLPKIFQSLRSVGANVETVANKLYEMDRGASGSGSPSSGETLNLKTESQSPHLSGSTGRAAGFAQPLSRASGEDVTRRLAALEDKIETLIKLVSERG
jgi:hypothetical protein